MRSVHKRCGCDITPSGLVDIKAGDVALLGKDELRKDFQYQLGSSSDNISFVGAKGITSQMEEYVAPAKDNLAKRWRTIASEVSVLTSVPIRKFLSTGFGVGLNIESSLTIAFD